MLYGVFRLRQCEGIWSYHVLPHSPAPNLQCEIHKGQALLWTHWIHFLSLLSASLSQIGSDKSIIT